MIQFFVTARTFDVLVLVVEQFLTCLLNFVL